MGAKSDAIVLFFEYRNEHMENTTLLSTDTQAVECSASSIVSYDMSMHIAALFILMACSLAGNLLPLFFKRMTSERFSRYVLAGIKMFGAGVMLSTAL